MTSRVEKLLLLALVSRFALVDCAASAGETPRFRIDQQKDAWTVLDPSGRPTFLVGINHLRDNVRAGVDRNEFYSAALEHLRGWGVNHLGYGAPVELRDKMPFLQEQRYTYASQFRTREQFRYIDVFDLDVQQKMREKVRAICSAVGDEPNLIGHYWTDTTRWSIDTSRRLRGHDWVSFFRELPPDSAGKRRYTKFLRQRYHNTPTAYSEAYGHLIDDFEDIRLFDFREFDRRSAAGRRDDEAFLGIVATELFRVLGEAYREFAPEVLVFGERFKLHDHPDVVLEAIAPWVDVISIQPGPEVGPRPGPGRDERVFDEATFDRIHELTGKPILICDHRVSFRTPSTPVTLWHQFTTADEAVESARRFMLAAASKPYIVGYSHCQYLDSRSRERGNMVKPGFLNEDGQPYAIYVQGIAEATAEAKGRHAAKFLEQSR